MAISTTLNIIVSSIVKVVNNKEENHRKFSSVPDKEGRRGVLLSTVFLAAEITDSRTELLQKYLKKSEANKSKNDKERLDSYYKRNYQDYFGYLEGTLKQKREDLTDSEKGILEWLQTNK